VLFLKREKNFMNATGSSRLSIKKLGKLDEIVLEKGSNNKDGWGYTKNPDDERTPLVPRKISRFLWRAFR